MQSLSNRFYDGSRKFHLYSGLKDFSLLKKKINVLKLREMFRWKLNSIESKFIAKTISSRKLWGVQHGGSAVTLAAQ